MLKNLLEQADEICKQNGTKLARDGQGEILVVESHTSSMKVRVRKMCQANPTHKFSDVTLGSILHTKRGGCGTCARSKGGKTSKRGAAGQSKTN